MREIQRHRNSVSAVVTPIIEFRDVTRTFVTPEGDRIAALDHVNLSVREGEIHGVIGLSGAGKSTLVRCINGIELPTSGTVLVEGQNISALKRRELQKLRADIGMIFQSFNLMPSRTVQDNVALALINSGLSRTQQNKRIEELLEMVELSDRADRYPSELSGGQKQRVAIARALANHPRILLSDEATSALDPLTTESILSLLRRVNQELGVTVVIIAHQMPVIRDVCDRVAVMENGCIVERGDVRDVFLKPQAALTRQFIETTSNLAKAEGIRSGRYGALAIHDDSTILRLRYVNRTVSAPLITQAARKFNTDINIMFADVSMIGGVPMGGTVIAIDGSADNRDSIVEYFKQQGIEVEVVA